MTPDSKLSLARSPSIVSQHESRPVLMLYGKGEHLASGWLQRRQAAWSRPRPVSLTLPQRWQLRLQAPYTAHDCHRPHECCQDLLPLQSWNIITIHRPCTRLAR